MKIGVVLPAAEVDGDGATPSWREVRAFGVAADDRGLDSVWMFDHFFSREGGGSIEGMHESWTILSAIGAVTSRVQLGTLVLCAGFRSAGLLAKMAASLDEVSGGRLILGIGAGWYDEEYEAFGYPTERRVDRFEETLRVLRPLLDGEAVTFSGEFTHLREAVLAPPPSRHIPILVAADGPRMLRLTARHADAWNTAWFGLPDEGLRSSLASFDDALEAEGRDPGSVEGTVGVSIYDPGAAVLEDEEPAFRGSVDEMASLFEAYADLGIDHLIVGVVPKTVASLDRIAGAITRASRR